jgi:glutamate-1-semialdehyde 2,1-aminomutase
MNKGQKLWKNAMKIIPDGNMLLSKNPDMFLPGYWPTYFSKAKGCKVWDLNNKEYIDMSIMGVGTNILGYGRHEVDQAVTRTLKKGNMSTLNCPEEVYLAEKLIKIHPWADMVRFTRTGGEANAIAIRLARAYSGRDKIAVCGYHGWHDWYLSANLKDNNSLNNHLLPGLETGGVPKKLKGTVLTFNYNQYEQLEDLVNKHNDIGVIKMEVQRDNVPAKNFLKNIRELANKKEIVLIFDECTSGFRETYGGLYKKYNVQPDIIIFGKAIGNGYAINAILGKKKIMEMTKSTFISSTFWTERIGPTAAIKTLEIMKREKSWKKITKTGLEIKKRWKKLADRYELNLLISGLSALPNFRIESKNQLAYKTLITQEMLSKGYLAGNSVYVCTEHNSEILNGYFEELDKIFNLIKECEEGRDIKKLLKGKICRSGFKRLT